MTHRDSFLGLSFHVLLSKKVNKGRNQYIVVNVLDTKFFCVLTISIVLNECP